LVIEECRNGHKMTPENCIWKKDGDRVRDTPACRACKRIQDRRSARRQKPKESKPRPTYRWYGDKCIRGHLLTEESAGQRVTASGIRLYCRECSRIVNSKRRMDPEDRKPRGLGDMCPAGKHLLTEETAKVYAGKSSYTCLPCKRERDKQYKLEHPEKAAERRSEKRTGGHKGTGPTIRQRRPEPGGRNAAYNRRQREQRILQVSLRDESLLGEELSKADDERPGAVWNLLKPTGKAREALHDLHARQDEVLDEGGSWNCRDNPEEFMDSWLDEDDEGEFPTPPAPNRVRSMCADCPLFVVCQQYGIVSRDPGIWGGLRVGLDGKIYD
jgi:hypothetical protein